MALDLAIGEVFGREVEDVVAAPMDCWAIDEDRGAASRVVGHEVRVEGTVPLDDVIAAMDDASSENPGSWTAAVEVSADAVEVAAPEDLKAQSMDDRATAKD